LCEFPEVCELGESLLELSDYGDEKGLVVSRSRILNEAIEEGLIEPFVGQGVGNVRRRVYAQLAFGFVESATQSDRVKNL
jgi:hypothetical protein